MCEKSSRWTPFFSSSARARELLALIEADEAERAALVDDAAAFVEEALA